MDLLNISYSPQLVIERAEGPLTKKILLKHFEHDLQLPSGELTRRLVYPPFEYYVQYETEESKSKMLLDTFIDSLIFSSSGDHKVMVDFNEGKVFTGSLEPLDLKGTFRYDIKKSSYNVFTDEERFISNIEYERSFYSKDNRVILTLYPARDIDHPLQVLSFKDGQGIIKYVKSLFLSSGHMMYDKMVYDTASREIWLNYNGGTNYTFSKVGYIEIKDI